MPNSILSPFQFRKENLSISFVSQLEKEDSLLRGPAIVEANLEDFMHLFMGWQEEVQCLIKVCYIFV
jgi:hypothetical protein